jgi:hypothetical protein
MAHSATKAIRLQLIEALRRRAAGYEGETRRLLDERLSTLLADQAGDVDRVEVVREAAFGWIDDLTSRPAKHARDTFPELPMLDEFKRIWSTLHTENRMRQSLEPVPTDAGPLNSSALVHRSIELMRELSPGYLEHFLAYVDHLSWMARLAESAAPAANDALRPASIGKRSRKKTAAPR